MFWMMDLATTSAGAHVPGLSSHTASTPATTLPTPPAEPHGLVLGCIHRQLGRASQPATHHFHVPL